MNYLFGIFTHDLRICIYFFSFGNLNARPDMIWYDLFDSHVDINVLKIVVHRVSQYTSDYNFVI